MKNEEGIDPNLFGAAAAAHDIKTPLVFIKNAAEQIISSRDPKSPDNIKQLVRIEQSAQRLLRLVDSIVGIADQTQTSLKLEPTDPAELINDVLADVSPYAEQLGVGFEAKVTGNLPLILTHRVSLKRVLFNLLDNAVKHSNTKKRVQISARRNDSKIKISVRDFGSGLSSKELSRVLKLFGKARQPSPKLSGSSGLGLYIVNDLCQKLSAELAISNKGQGSVFSIRLPIANQLSLFL